MKLSFYPKKSILLKKKSKIGSKVKEKRTLLMIKKSSKITRFLNIYKKIIIILLQKNHSFSSKEKVVLEKAFRENNKLSVQKLNEL